MASAVRPASRHAIARLYCMVSVWGWSGPNFDSESLSVAS